MAWDDFDDTVKTFNRGGGFRCGVEKFLDVIGDEGREAVEKVLANPQRTNTSINKALTAKAEALELDVLVPADFVISRHRRGECRCAKDKA